jgi:hypothetical protein
VKPFFCFYGGKWRAAPHYPPPRFGMIVEPFAGAAGYATRYSERDVVLVERDPVIAGLWRFLTKATTWEIRQIPLLHPGETVDDLHVNDEARALVGFWVNKGSAQPKKSQSAWMRAGTHVTSFWGEAIRERVASQVERIRHWRVFEGDYSCVADFEATWFIDPPYAGPVGRRYRFSEIDFQSLALWTRARRGQVIACENEGATWLPFRPFRKIKANEGSNGHGVSAEAIYEQMGQHGEIVGEV